MIEQDNNIYRIVYRNYDRVVDGDSNRLKLSSASRSNIAINLSKMEKANVETSDTPKVTVYDNTASKGSDLGYVVLPLERVPVSAIIVASNAVKTKKGDNIRENAKKNVTVQVDYSAKDNAVNDDSYIAGIEKTVGTSRSNYSADVDVQQNGDSYSVSVKNSDNVGHKFNSGRNIAKQLEHFEEKENEPIKSETISQEDNKAWVDVNFANAAVDVDNNKVENNTPERKHEVSKNVPEYGTSSSDIFGGTISKNENLSSDTEKKAESKSVVNTNDLISSIPNPIEIHENKEKVREEKEDQLTDVHNKLFGIEHEVSHDIVSKESLVGVTSNTDEASKFRSRLQKLSKKKANVEETREANETVNQNLEKTMVNGTKLREELELYKKTIEKKITDIETKIAQEEAEELRRKAELEESLRKEEDNYNSMQHEINEFKEIERELGVPSSGMRR